MSFLASILIVLAVVAVAVAAMLLVRRRAPEGSYFADGDRAAGVFGVLATGFAVLIGFVVFLAFQSYDTSRTGAEAEARGVAQELETVQLMPVAQRAALSGMLICYARTVVFDEWPKMEDGALGDRLNPWGAAMFRVLKTVEPRTPVEQTAYAKWFEQRFDRENARADRVHGGSGVIPDPLWIVLFLSAAVIFGYMLLFADRAERAFVQAALIGCVALVITSTLLLLSFLDNPYRRGPGELRPVAMERTLRIVKEEAAFLRGVTPPCDERGAPA